MSNQSSNDILVKLNVLKKALLEERNKSEYLTKEIGQYKEELIIKQEQIDKLKEELLQFKDNSSKKQIKRFFSNLFTEEDEEIQQKQLFDNTKLTKENEELLEKVKSLQNEKSFINTKLNETMSDYSNLKAKYEAKFAEIQKDSSDQLQKYIKEISTKNQQIAEQIGRIKIMTELCKTFDMQKFEFEKQISELKKEINDREATIQLKVDEINHLFQEQSHYLEQIEENKKEIDNLKNELLKYKPQYFDDEDNIDINQININYIFKGEILPTNKNEPKKKVEICFGKQKDCLSFKIEGNEEKIFPNSDINDITKNTKYKDRVWINIVQNKNQQNYACRFAPNKIDIILNYYEKIKVKPGILEAAFQNVTFGDYFY